ncbi:hypothetical protein ES332_A13G070900v1 [Gossypium tomentosum]|uniref:Uncharacterized protein n=1 Tax=Gossypium tomentosum TaxID=34277 RepID=A0A5D2MH91_GOSTO|nr:hypothetical protein ES332_A13G070900v1 [Gossypium tomentosum]
MMTIYKHALASAVVGFKLFFPGLYRTGTYSLATFHRCVRILLGIFRIL